MTYEDPGIRGIVIAKDRQTYQMFRVCIRSFNLKCSYITIVIIINVSVGSKRPLINLF